MAAYTVGLAEAKNNFSKITQIVNKTGKPVTVLKNNKPWVIIAPAAAAEGEEGAVVDLMDSVSYTLMILDDEEK
ncbi:MAG: type II toxin-antitoxin system Phd/YefM family antitoxin [Coriobacteriales bacterium]|nr:type II toxin-antitoxin system Phd/YefM family antitoxin [Coriobacteriales bacterium]MBQ6586077.1 type II toxin-antitoxin system Phd/YefM family antitoxin [Coriobacteriales bacterium]